MRFLVLFSSPSSLPFSLYLPTPFFSNATHTLGDDHTGEEREMREGEVEIKQQKKKERRCGVTSPT